MNLKSIKLAGFKSFVDPIIIPINSSLTGIVGPNGCGKSNVVDAIRWVIGESSAKQLRGQAMADVIFNGATHRKPVGQAVVELVFDNSDGRISGEYAKFSEISVRREVQREGQSQYMLNGVQCRRRDITNLFLGTGLGARSYAIIEQGVISELIEAKPEELRSHLEEVSGISKYKERRRETELRMRHTQENLDRLNDLNEELSKQLRHLKRQAEAAERYSELKQQERILQAEIKVLHWQKLSQQLLDQQVPLAQCQLVQEQQTALLREVETRLEKNRLEHHEINAQRDEIQRNFFAMDKEIARLEQRIQSLQEQILRWRKEQQEVEQLYHELEEHAQEQRLNIEELQTELGLLAPQTAAAKTTALAAGQTLQDAEKQMREMQQIWDVFQQEFSQLTSQISVLTNNLHHYEQQRAHLYSRQAQLHERQKQLPLSSLTEEISPLTSEVETHRQELEALKTAQDQLNESSRILRQQNAQTKEEWERQNKLLQGLQQRNASLEALQQSALGFHDNQIQDWLKKYALHSQARLAQVLHVTSGWELAVETVLGSYIDAVCLTHLEEWIEPLAQIQQGRLTLIEEATEQSPAVVSLHLPLLSSRIHSAWPLSGWVAGVYCAEDLAQAMTLRDQLQPEESIITKEGIWLGKNWIRVNRGKNKESGVIVREQELKQLAQEILQAREKLLWLQASLAEGEESLRDLEEQRDSYHRNFQKISAKLTELQGQLSGRQSRLAELEHQQQRLSKEISECELSIQNLQGLYAKNQEQLANYKHKEADHNQKKIELLQLLEERRQELAKVRQQTDQQRRTADELSIRCAAIENELALLKQSSLRDERQRQQLSERREQLANRSENEEVLEDLRAELQQQLALRLKIEEDLRKAQDLLTTHIKNQEQLNRQRQNTQEQLTAAQTEWQHLQMEQQALSVRQSAIQEQLAEQNWVLEELLTHLPAHANAEQWEQQLIAVAATNSAIRSH